MYDIHIYIHIRQLVRVHFNLESPLGGFHILTGSIAVSDVTDLDSFNQCKHYTDDTLVGESLTIPCDVTRLARYVAIVLRQSDVKLYFCDVEVLAGLRTFSLHLQIVRYLINVRVYTMSGEFFCVIVI